MSKFAFMKCRKFIITIFAVFAIALASVPGAKAQFIDATQGLMLSPSAEMNQDGTFMIINNMLNKHYSPSPKWDYHTFGYGFSITMWERLEVAYTMTIFYGKWDPHADDYRSQIIRNQDRHFVARVQALREGDFWEWMPSVVLGISDPVTGSGGDYLDGNVGESGNGYFNRAYIAATKHFNTNWGVVGAHASYTTTKRRDFLKKRPTAGITWDPVWLNRDDSFLSSFRLIAEYDTRNINLGFTTSIYKDHFEGMFCLEGCKWINFGMRYKLVLTH